LNRTRASGPCLLRHGADRPGVCFANRQLRDLLRGSRPLAAGTAGAFLTALVPVMWAYSGWHLVGPVGEEVENPDKTIPRALVELSATPSHSQGKVCPLLAQGSGSDRRISPPHPGSPRGRPISKSIMLSLAGQTRRLESFFLAPLAWKCSGGSL